ncbi:hypothetical protein C5167_040890 [Papaver somniferum]|uniref:Uncharacterized protein n=1 Tax=Papaver somniferum TaxID=3469 RepID=A0A4Y7IIP5_PAPSO|nr:hypothetical protein C5167_040890 [Papaver somniferum]
MATFDVMEEFRFHAHGSLDGPEHDQDHMEARLDLDAPLLGGLAALQEVD